YAPAALDVARHGAARRFDLAGRQAASRRGLEPVVAERHFVAARGYAPVASLLLLAVLGSCRLKHESLLRSLGLAGFLHRGLGVGLGLGSGLALGLRPTVARGLPCSRSLRPSCLGLRVRRGRLCRDGRGLGLLVRRCGPGRELFHLPRRRLLGRRGGGPGPPLAPSPPPPLLTPPLHPP